MTAEDPRYLIIRRRPDGFMAECRDIGHRTEELARKMLADEIAKAGKTLASRREVHRAFATWIKDMEGSTFQLVTVQVQVDAKPFAVEAR